MGKRQDILQWVFIDCCKNGRIKDSLIRCVEGRVDVYAEDTQNAARKGIHIFENNTQEEIKTLPMCQLK